MAGFGEPLDWTRRREEEAKDVFPTLQFSDPDQNMEVDVFASQNLDRPMSAFSQSALGLANYAYVPEPTVEAPDVAPNIEGWTPQIQRRRSIYDEQPAFGSSAEEMAAGYAPPTPERGAFQGAITSPEWSPTKFVLNLDAIKNIVPESLATQIGQAQMPEIQAIEQARQTGQYGGLFSPEFYGNVQQAQQAAESSAPGVVFRAATTPYVTTQGGDAITRAIIERATTPLTYVGGPKIIGQTILGAGLGAGAKEITAALGGGETAQSIAELIGETTPFAPEVYGLAKGTAGVAKTWMQAAEDSLGLARMAEREAAPEAFQIGRAAGEGRVPFYGGTRPGEVPVPLQRPAMAGAADLSELSDDALEASINAFRNAEAAGRPTAPGLFEKLSAEKARRAINEPQKVMPEALPEYLPLPETLARSSPRYRNQTLEFESDLDKALYTVGNVQTRSKSHDKFMDWLRDVTGLEDKEIYAVARERRAEIISDVKTQPNEANVVIPRKETARAAAPEPKVAAAPEPVAPSQAAAAAPTTQAAPPPPPAPPTPPTAAGAGGGSLESAMSKIGAGLDEEIDLRRRGVVEEEKAAGGKTRAARMADARNAAIARGASIEEVQAEVRQAATTGRYRKTFGKPIDISPEEELAIQNEIRRVINPTGTAERAFDENRTIDAIAKLQSGEGIEPSQVRLLAKVLGKDLANKLIRANRGRISTVADLDANAKSIVDSAKRGEKAIATTEQKAFAQRELADALAQQANLEPNNKRLAAAAEKAARRADELSARADDLLQTAAMKTVGESQDALELAAQRASIGNAISELRKAELAQRSGQQLTEQQDALLRIRDLLGRRIAVSDPRAQQIMNVLNAGMAADTANFNRIKNDAPWFSFIKSAIEGGPANSFVAEAFNRANQMKTALLQEGMSETLANRISRAVFDHNVNQHYNGNVPADILKMISDARSVGAGSANLGSFVLLQQRLKNTLFGLDFQALGGILRTAIQEGNIQAAAGLVNRTLAAAHLPHVNTMIDDANISRRAQFAIDGRRYGIGAAAQEPVSGTVLKYAENLPGGFGRTIRAVDNAYSRISDASTRAQYDVLAANLGDLIHEGNLVIDRIIGRRDITNPVVRARSAENANNLIAFGRNAINGNRRAAEGFLVTSASQTRARFGRILDSYVKLANPKSSVEERLHAASMIASQYLVYNTLMQYINDKIGIGEIELDPSKGGYGIITTNWKDKDGNNVQLPVINNDSVQRAFARSIRVLADAKENDKSQKILEQWEKTALGVAGPVIKDVAAGGFGMGYVPGVGYKFGTMTPSERFTSVLPLPATAQPLIRGEGFGATGLEAIGQPVYTGPGSAVNVLEDIANKKYGNTKDFYDRTPRERADVLSENPQLRDKYEQAKIERGGTTGAATVVLQEARKNLQGIDEALKSKRTEGGQPFSAKDWRENYHQILDSLRDKRDAIYINAETQPGKDPVLDGYFKAIDAAVDPTTKKVNWDAVDAYKSKLDNADQKYIEENTGLSVDSPTVRQYKSDVKQIVDSGYFDAGDNIVKEVAKQFGMKGIENRKQFDAELEKQLAPSVGNNPYMLKLAIDKIDGVINQATGKYKLYIFSQHPEIIPLLEKWDYGMSSTGLKLGAAMSMTPAGVR